MESSTSQSPTPLLAERWVISEQVNRTTGAIVITYKAGVMSDDEMRSHLASLLQTAKNAQMPKLQPSTSYPESQRENQHTTTEQPAKVTYSIAHAIPGRVRFHVPEIAVDPTYVERLETLVKEDPAVTSERINRNAASIVITYKTGMLRDSQTRVQRIFKAVKSHLDSLIQSASDATLTIV